MELRRTVVTGAVVAKFAGAVGAREIEVIASDATVDRVGDILMPAGCRLANYRKNPVVLAQHDSHQPIARCSSIGQQGDKIVAKIAFPPEGTSARSDEYCRLAKAGIISAVSVGFMPIKAEPIQGTSGLRFTEWELMELSLVSVPANANAIVTAKAHRSATPNLDAMRVRLARLRLGRGYETALEAEQAAIRDRVERLRERYGRSRR